MIEGEEEGERQQLHLGHPATVFRHIQSLASQQDQLRTGKRERERERGGERGGRGEGGISAAYLPLIRFSLQPCGWFL